MTRQKKESNSGFAKELAACGNDAAALLALGKSCFLAQRYRESVDAYRRCIDVKRDSDAAWFNMGVAWQALENFAEAKRAFMRVLELNPNHEAAQEALNNLAAY